MTLKHADIWRAIDRLAERHKLSASGLARKAGLSPTLFNPSKRTANNRERWPSTESIARILQATGANLDDFVALATNVQAVQVSLPSLDLKTAANKNAFNAKGLPHGKAWEKVHFPMLADLDAFALEISGKAYEPVYYEGTRIIVSPADPVRRGDRVAVRTINGKITFLELSREKVDVIDFVSLGPKTAIKLPRSKIQWMYRILWASQ